MRKKHACDIFSEGETSEHLRGKKLLMTWLRKEGKNPQIEAYLTSLHQRPDICVIIKLLSFNVRQYL
ncbi:competence protein CoiA family protein [Ligilactobacillus salivarius]|uniref:competence protein CoiA family protein n=1 Tax=Ligilactobacillus salivarius TaxID=1624 RepID=UPI00235EF0D3|nr:competence protein CoiA family protein [Ligilactobacillus salivarius]MDD1403779.1 competence protein CoiA family protein [Ligilactobacillus salivarius]